MPRVSPAVLRSAARTLPLLARLFRGVRDLPQATRELQWIQNELPPSQWKSAVDRRSRNEPLQYILGSQPFGPLNIICRPGALIPRWETEEWVLEVAEILQKANIRSTPFTIVDACTGTGCIPLLLEHELRGNGNVVVRTLGFDASDAALAVAQENVAVIDLKIGNTTTKILHGDLFNASVLHTIGVSAANLITANPPYIPHSDYYRPVLLNGVELSARLYEPREALVGDTAFYSALLDHIVLPLAADGFVFELGYDHQADFVHCHLQTLENSKWSVGRRYDSAGNIRCVVGWQKEGNLACLLQICQTIYEE